MQRILTFFSTKNNIAKDSHIFSTKNNSVFVIFMFEILTNRYLTTLLILNNWALVARTYYDKDGD